MGFRQERNYRRTKVVRRDGGRYCRRKDLAALNAKEPRTLFAEIKRARETFIENIVKRNPSQKVFRNGWLRRLNSIGYGNLTYGNNTVHKFTDV